MSKEKGDHLYVMQASTGRIKIGRSFDPKGRRRELQSASGQHITLVAVLKEQGHRERDIHQRLAAHRFLGEWFQCTEEAKAAICEAVGLSLNFHRYRNHLDAALKQNKLTLEQAKLTLQAEEDARKSAARKAAEETFERAVEEIRLGGHGRAGRYPLRERAWALRHAYYAGRTTLERVNEAMVLAGLPLIESEAGERPVIRLSKR